MISRSSLGVYKGPHSQPLCDQPVMNFHPVRVRRNIIGCRSPSSCKCGVLLYEDEIQGAVDASPSQHHTQPHNLENVLESHPKRDTAAGADETNLLSLPPELMQELAKELTGSLDRICFALVSRSTYTAVKAIDSEEFKEMIPRPELVSERPYPQLWTSIPEELRFGQPANEWRRSSRAVVPTNGPFKPLVIKKDGSINEEGLCVHQMYTYRRRAMLAGQLVPRLWNWMKSRCVFCGWQNKGGAEDAACDRHICLPLPADGRVSPYRYKDFIPLPLLHPDAFRFRKDDPWFWLRYCHITDKERMLLGHGRYPEHLRGALDDVLGQQVLHEADTDDLRSSVTQEVIIAALKRDRPTEFAPFLSEAGDEFLALMRFEHWAQGHSFGASRVAGQDREQEDRVRRFRSLAMSRQRQGIVWACERRNRLGYGSDDVDWDAICEAEFMQEWMEAMEQEERDLEERSRQARYKEKLDEMKKLRTGQHKVPSLTARNQQHKGR